MSVATPETSAVPVCGCQSRPRVPQHASGRTTSFQVGDAEGYLMTREFDDGSLAGVQVKLGKQGSTMSGVMEAFAEMMSLALESGVPLSRVVERLHGMKFEPAGLTDDRELKRATSIIDYLVRRLAIDYLPAAERAQLGILSATEKFAA